MLEIAKQLETQVKTYQGDKLALWKKLSPIFDSIMFELCADDMARECGETIVYGSTD